MRVGNFAHEVSPSMVVDNLNVPRTLRCPKKAHTKLVVDANAILPGAPALQRFQSVARRHPEIVECHGPVEHCQLAHGHRLDVHKPPDTNAAKQRLRLGALERADSNLRIVTVRVSIVKRLYANVSNQSRNVPCVTKVEVSSL